MSWLLVIHASVDSSSVKSPTTTTESGAGAPAASQSQPSIVTSVARTVWSVVLSWASGNNWRTSAYRPAVHNAIRWFRVA